MPDTLWTLRQKARAAMEVLNALTPTERMHRPTGAFADNYNTLRRLALEALPSAKEFFPPEASVETTPNGPVSRQSHAELLVWTNEVFKMIGDERDRIEKANQAKEAAAIEAARRDYRGPRPPWSR